MLRGLHLRWPAWARAVTALVLLAMCVRVATPPGYMLAASGDGRYITVTFCSGHGPTNSLLDLRTGEIVEATKAPGEKEPEGRTHRDSPCVFAAAAHLAAPEAPFVLQTDFRIVAAPRVLAIAQTPGRGLAAPPPWATGPPLTA